MTDPDEAQSSPQAHPSLGRGAAIITVATAVSRITGFLRVVAVAYAMGATYLANTYQTANTAPNLVFELLAAGVLTSVFVPTFVEHLVKGQREEGWRAANALTSVALVALMGVALIVALAAPLIMRVLLIGVDPAVRDDSVAVGSTFLRLFAPQILFYGAGMIMTGALHAHRKFTLPAIAPIFNNLVVIAVYLTYALMRRDGTGDPGEVTTAQQWVLGAGTTLGVVAMTICLLPALRRLGWHFRFNLDLAHPAVRKGARLGAWALGYAGGYQAGLVVVLLLANGIEGGVAGYQWAYTFFYLPHALFGVPIFNVLFTAMAEHAAKGENAAVTTRIGDGLRMLFFILAPMAVALAVLAGPLTQLTLEYGLMSRAGAELVARILMAFAVGLPAYSIFLVFTRGFYALSDTKTPALLNALTVAIASAAGAILFLSAPDGWEVAGLALGHSLGFAVGAALLGRRLFKRLASELGGTTFRSMWRSLVVALGAGVVMWGARELIPEGGKPLTLASLLLAGGLGAAFYVFIMTRLRASEITTLTGLMRSLRPRR